MKNPLTGSVCFNIASAEQDDEPHSTFEEYVALAHSEMTNKTPLLKHDSSSYEDTITQLKEENQELVEKNFELTIKLDEALEENYILQDKIEDDFSLVKDEATGKILLDGSVSSISQIKVAVVFGRDLRVGSARWCSQNEA
ncbi:hypothetical protein LWI29_000283 [Acer saccharum]|uniref:Uncharacterized protein n=1 Tax=Acer saccharum TaxID=4024 RepID=A0AA39RJN5_ACESA|nr:hypothetical protein LWI29_000283 [Acer saccharum]